MPENDAEVKPMNGRNKRGSNSNLFDGGAGHKPPVTPGALLLRRFFVVGRKSASETTTFNSTGRNNFLIFLPIFVFWYAANASPVKRVGWAGPSALGVGGPVSSEIS